MNLPNVSWSFTLTRCHLDANSPPHHAVTLPALGEMRHAKSTRDILVAPLKPIIRDSRTRALFAETQGQVEEGWRSEGMEKEEVMSDMIEVSHARTKGLKGTNRPNSSVTKSKGKWKDDNQTT